MTPQPPNAPAARASTAPPSLDDAIQRDALDCVMCGICVPHCPTFSLTGNEADGPRGRISLMLGISQGGLEPDASVRHHLDTCLTCRACETVCPSGVRYGRLVDNGRARLAQTETPEARPRAQGKPWRLLRDQLLTRRRRLGMAFGLYRTATRLGLGGMVRRLAGPIGRALPRRPADPVGTPISGIEPTRGSVGLFVGCTGGAMNAPAARAAESVMRAMGYRVVTPGDQVCCGAMHAHGGEPAAASSLRARNARVFAGKDVDTIAVVGTACRSELGALETEHGIKVREITEWLLERPSDEWPALGALDQHVAVHTPCSQRNHLKSPDATRQLLERIPRLTLTDIDGNARCCGAAGLQALLYPEEAERLRAPKLESIASIRPDAVVSANVGCATHFAAGADLEVRQPVELIAESIAAAKS